MNQTIHTILNDTPTLQIHSYGPSAGLPQVREQLARSLNRRFGMDYQPEHLFMASGAAGALGHALRAVTEPGDEIIVFAPYFPEYRPYTQGAGLRLSVVPADVDSFQINFRALEERLNPAVTALLINSPNNPSGIVLSSETLTQLAALLEEKQRQFGHPIYLISDEPYRELLLQGHHRVLLLLQVPVPARRAHRLSGGESQGGAGHDHRRGVPPDLPDHRLQWHLHPDAADGGPLRRPDQPAGDL